MRSFFFWNSPIPWNRNFTSKMRKSIRPGIAEIEVFWLWKLFPPKLFFGKLGQEIALGLFECDLLYWGLFVCDELFWRKFVRADVLFWGKFVRAAVLFWGKFVRTVVLFVLCCRIFGFSKSVWLFSLGTSELVKLDHFD